VFFLYCGCSCIILLGSLLFELMKRFHIARYLAAKIGTNSGILI
jgi:hypothetical protein